MTGVLLFLMLRFAGGGDKKKSSCEQLGRVGWLVARVKRKGADTSLTRLPRGEAETVRLP